MPYLVWAALLAFGWAAALLRARYARATPMDRWINNFRLLQTAMCTLVSPWAQQLLSPPVALQCAVLVYVFDCEISRRVLVAIAHRGERPDTRRALLAGLATAAVLFGCGLPALCHGHTPFDYPGPSTVAYWLVAGVTVGRWARPLICAVVAELRERPRRFEVAVYLGFGTLTAAALVMPSLLIGNAVLLAVRHDSALTDPLRLACPIYWLVLATASAVLFGRPVLVGVLEQCGLGPAARRQRVLLPLWRDLTGVCPEVVHDTPAPVAGDRYRLHRTVIEIRDAMLLLARHSPEPTPGEQADPVARAVRLARAARARQRGELPLGSAVPPPSAAVDLLSEADELAALARVWAAAFEAA